MKVLLSTKLGLLCLLGSVTGLPIAAGADVSVTNLRGLNEDEDANETEAFVPESLMQMNQTDTTAMLPAPTETESSTETESPEDTTANTTSTTSTTTEETATETSSNPTTLTSSNGTTTEETEAETGPETGPETETENPAPTTTETTETSSPSKHVLETEAPTNQETETPTGDDDMEEEYYEGAEGGGEDWGFGSETEEKKTPAPYVPPTEDDPFENPTDESEWAGPEWKQETTEEMMHDKNVIIAVTSAVAFGFVLAVFSAQQVIENPDGCCASLCRCSVKFFCFFFKILCFPCRMCCGNKDRRTHDLMIGGSDSYTHDLELT